MYAARLLYPVEVLGPGKRVGIWFCGCPRRCKGCSNPELWDFHEKYKTSPDMIYKLVSKVAENNHIDGFTITGGDPLYQPTALQELICLLQKFSDDFLVYTGYLKNELSDASLSGISVLIDGEYIESRNNNALLRGSDNQQIYILDENKRSKYESYFKTATNQIQNFVMPEGVVSVGIHRPNFLRY